MQDFLYGLENLILAEWLFSGVISEEQIEPSTPGRFIASGAAFPSAINLAVPLWHLLDKLALKLRKLSKTIREALDMK